MRIEEDCQRMKTLQATIVNLLHESMGNILDNEALVAALYETKETYSIVVDRLNDSRESEKVLIGIKEKYRPVAEFGVKFLNIVLRLREIDPFYFVPLESFVSTFCSCVQKLEGENSKPEINLNRIQSVIGDSIKGIFNLVQPCLTREDSITFVNAIWRLVCQQNQCQSDFNEISHRMGFKLFEKLNLNSFLKHKQAHILIIPKNNSLESLISDLRELQTNVVINFISVGNGNEEIVLKMLDVAYKDRHILVLQNVHFSRNVVERIEHQFAEIKSNVIERNDFSIGNFRLILIVDYSHQVPQSILYNSCVLTYYSERLEVVQK